MTATIPSPSITSHPSRDDGFDLVDLRLGIAEQLRDPFRGGIVENCGRFQFHGSGYDAMPEEQNRYFCIETARQCAGPMRALTDDRVRVVHVIGATQVLKSMVGDAWTIYSVEHERLPILILFEDDPKADLFCGRRLMDTIKRHSAIARMLEDTKKEDRHRVTGTWIKFLDFEMLVAGLNDGNVSTLSWPRIWISEGWQHGSDGLLPKAFKRADRYPNTHKILNESQASMAGTDLHRAVQKAQMVPLVWRCPGCGGEQTWEWRHWSHKRADDFVARLTRAKVLEILEKHGCPEKIDAVMDRLLHGLHGLTRIQNENENI